MTTIVQSPYSQSQMTAWLRGLLTVAWADGNFDAVEQELINELTREELAPCLNADHFDPIAAPELAAQLGEDRRMRENFMRTAVMVAVADGVYSTSEDEMLQAFCQALNLDGAALDALRATIDSPPTSPEQSPVQGAVSPLRPPEPKAGRDVLRPARDWLDGLDIEDPRLARFLCKLIPAQCPFERDVKLFGRKVVHIPPMCKLNPLYDQLVGLRFRSLCYLADDCGEDVSEYC